MSTIQQPIEPGDRFESEDSRDTGRVVEVIEIVDGPRYVGDARGSLYRVRTEAHPKNPQAVGNVSRVAERTLRKNYRRVSR
jgi:hypothetical protein